MRCNEFAGSLKISLYCGLRIFPSLFLVVGYDGAGRSIAMSALFEYRRAPKDCPMSVLHGLSAATGSEASPGGFFGFRLVLDTLGSPKSSSPSLLS